MGESIIIIFGMNMLMLQDDRQAWVREDKGTDTLTDTGGRRQSGTEGGREAREADCRWSDDVSVSQ